jgi:Zn-dependent metalloprotease
LLLTCNHIFIKNLFIKLINPKITMKKNLLLLAVIGALWLRPTSGCMGQTESGPFLINVENAVARSAVPTELIRNRLQTGVYDSFALLQSDKTSDFLTQKSDVFSLEKYQQYYKGIKVEHGVINLNYKRGSLKSLSGEYHKIETLSTTPSISEQYALSQVLSHVNAKKYKWQLPEEEKMLKTTTGKLDATHYPKGEIVICKDYLGKNMHKPVLAYKFDVYAVEPLRRDYIYVNAHTGEIIFVNPILKEDSYPSVGQANTRYSGLRNISTTKTDNHYYLKDYTRGSGVETFNLKHGIATSGAVDFIDNDNQWTAAEYNNSEKDNAALDAHFGALQAYDYFLKKHNWNSLDGAGKKIQSYVHYGYNVFNAYWDGAAVLFGDGDGQSDPLTTLDISGHEIAHGLCQYTANLVYAYEPGALNEGLSDIWGACIEHYTDPTKQTWIIGEDMKVPGRSMSNPNDFKNPDTYKGDFWFTESWDNGGVHFNSGVINHWFYTLSVGKSGVNDHGVSYTVEGIGMDKAANIIFRTEVNYLTPNSQYNDARKFSIQAAIDIYGEGSNEVRQTENAWKAVGVYHKLTSPTSLTATAINNNSIKLIWNDNSSDETGFKVERGEITSSQFTEIATVNANNVTYTDNGLAANAIYFYRIRAFNDKGFSDYSNVQYASLGTTSNVVVMKDTVVTTCNTIFLDPGAIGNYPDNKNYITTFSPAVQGNKIAITFSEFLFENADYLYVHDGANINAPLIGRYFGSQLPPTMIATNPAGKLTIQFISSRENNFSGFKASITCIDSNFQPEAPDNLTAYVFSTKINLNWTDNSSFEKGFIIERSYHENVGFVKLAQVGANKISYIDLQTLPHTTYYYRVKAIGDNNSSLPSNTATVRTGDAPIIMSNNLTAVTCDAVFLDPGGFGNIPDNVMAVTTFYPSTLNKRIEVSFPEYSINFGSDILMVYDGPNTDSPLLFNSSTTTNWIGVLAATNPSGTITFKFTSETSNYKPSGWTALVRCIDYPPTAPTNLIASVNGNYINLTWKDNSNNEESFIIEKAYNYDPNHFAELATVSGDVTEYIDVSGYTPGNKMFYRIIAANAAGGKSSPSNIASFVAPIIMHNTDWYTNCEYPLLDPGASNHYADNSLTQMTLYPSTFRSKLSLSFTLFDTEQDHDFLMVYDGENTSSPLIGKFSGNALPPKISATNGGGTLTLVFVTDGAVNKAGWEAQVSCGVSAESKNKLNTQPSISNSVDEDLSTIVNQIEVFPSPASSSFKIKLPSSIKWNSIDIIDMEGNENKLSFATLEGVLEVDATTIKRGLYTIRLRSKNNTLTKRIFLK